MIKKIILLASCICSIATINAQTFSWAKSLGSGSNEEGRGVAVDASGNVYTTGYLTGSGDFDPGPGVVTLTSAGSTDVYISKLDALGNFVWAIRMGGTGPQSAAAIALDNSGNVYVTGQFNNTIDLDPGPGFAGFTSLGAQDVFIAKYDPSGNYVWSQRFGSMYHEAASDIAIDGSGNIITCGVFTGTTDFDPGAGTVNLTAGTTSDAYISKLDVNGNYVWAKQIGLNGSNIPTSLASDVIGNIYITGYYESATDFDPGAGAYSITSAGMQDIFFVKLDASGAFSWAGSMGGTVADYGRSIALDVSGNVLITGEFQGTADFDPTAGVYNLTAVAVKDIFVAKFNPATASFTWAARLGDTNNEIGYGITTDASSNVYLTGDFIGTVDFDPGAGSVLISSNGNQRDCFILKLDASGNYIWAGGFGSAFLGDDAFSICVDASANIYTTGYYQDVVDFDPGAGTSTLTAGGQLDVFILKIQQCAPPLAPTNTTPAASLTLCGNGSTTLTASGAGTLGWYTASTAGAYLGGGANFTTPVLGNTTTYYVQDSTCSEGTRTAITVTFSPAMSSNVSSQTNVTCNAGNDGTAGVSVSGGTPSYTYLWTPSGGTSPAAFNLNAGTYTCTITDAVGCIQTQMVSITEPAAIDVTIQTGGNVINAIQSGATYQWIDCNNNNLPIAGEINQTYSPAINGNYAVIITMGSCSDTSTCSSFTTGISVNELTQFSVYPNPTNNIVTVQMEQFHAGTYFELFNATGQLVCTKQAEGRSTSIELPDAAGIYLIRLNADGKTSNVRVIKK
jgi:hypothetical protein